MQPINQLIAVLDQIPWNLSQSIQYNLDSLPELLDETVFYPETVQLLNRPIPGLRNVKIYYPLADNYFHQVEYVLQRDIKPIEVLNSMIEFYDQTFTQDNADAISRLTGELPFQVEPEDRIADSLGGHIFFEGLIPYQDGLTLNLGS